MFTIFNFKFNRLILQVKFNAGRRGPGPVGLMFNLVRNALRSTRRGALPIQADRLSPTMAGAFRPGGGVRDPDGRPSRQQLREPTNMRQETNAPCAIRWPPANLFSPDALVRVAVSRIDNDRRQVRNNTVFQVISYDNAIPDVVWHHHANALV